MAVVWGGLASSVSLDDRAGGGGAFPRCLSSLTPKHHSHTLGMLLSLLGFRVLSQMTDACC